jgi:hypothetical protein
MPYLLESGGKIFNESFNSLASGPLSGTARMKAQDMTNVLKA